MIKKPESTGGAVDCLDPRDQAHLDAAARDPAYAAALRRHFQDQDASVRALLAGNGPVAEEPPQTRRHLRLV